MTFPSEHACIQEERVRGESWLCKMHHTLIMILMLFPRESLPGEVAHTLLKWQTARAAAGVWESVTWLECMRNLTQESVGLLLYAAVSVEIRCDWGWSSGAGGERKQKEIHMGDEMFVENEIKGPLKGKFTPEMKNVVVICSAACGWKGWWSVVYSTKTFLGLHSKNRVAALS